MDFINEDGGTLPPGGSISPPSNLLLNFAARPTAEKAAFRQSIAPRHWTVAEPYFVVGLKDAMPGDTASKAGATNAIYLLKVKDYSLAASWVNMLTNTAAPAIPA